jgi:acyl-CoA thioesterase
LSGCSAAERPPAARPPEQHRFDADIALRPAGAGAFDAEVASHWWVGRGPNGGYLAALILRGLIETVRAPERSPRSLTVHFLARPEAGPVRLECAVERAGRSLTSASARLLQDGRPIALALGAFSVPWPGIEYADARAPDVPAPEALAPLGPDAGLPDFVANFDTRWAVGAPPWSGAGQALSGGWLRFAEPRALDALAATAYLDAWSPSRCSPASSPRSPPRPST